MSVNDFPPEEFQDRLWRVRQAMSQMSLDWLILVHPVSIHWLTGSDAKSFQSFQCLVVAQDDKPLTVLTRLAEVTEFERDSLVGDIRGWGGREPEDPLAAFRRLVDSLGLTRGRVGLDVPSYYLHPYHYLGIREILGSALVAEPGNLVHDLKLVKSPRELELIRQAAGIADEAMEAFAERLAAGRTELELCGHVYETLLRRGSGLPASHLNLVSGERSAFAHGAPTMRRLKQGDACNIEFGAAASRYTATIGRQFSLGAPGSRLSEIYKVVREACDSCIDAIRPGVEASAPHEAAKAVIASAGLDRYRVHLTGYGIAPGFPPSWGEPLQLFTGSRHVLEEGMVVSVEPPVYIPEEDIGVRIVDNVLVTANGAEILSRFTRDMVQVD